MESYYFANYRLLTDMDPAQWAYTDFLRDFASPMPYRDTFMLRCIIEPRIESIFEKYSALPLVTDTGRYTLRKAPDGWGFLIPPQDCTMGAVLLASPDYREMVLHIEHRDYYVETLRRICTPNFPFSSIIRSCCEAGMTFRDGVPMHASFVEKDGEGVIFLGPSGMGKSTQAKLWQAHLDADFINGDRPGLRLIDGKWYAFGMPWDGKDGLHHQRGVPVKAFVVLEQAKENTIRRISPLEAKIALFHQAIIPAWDNRALNGIMPLLARLSGDVPFYHLSCQADKAAVELTYQTLFK